jgi:hypothetical protein
MLLTSGEMQKLGQGCCRHPGITVLSIVRGEPSDETVCGVRGAGDHLRRSTSNAWQCRPDVCAALSVMPSGRHACALARKRLPSR